MTQRPWRLALSVQASLVQASWTGVRLMLGYRALALGADPFFLGLLASSFALPALLAALPAGRLTDRVGGSVVAITGMLIAAAGTAGGFALPGQWTLLAAAVCIGFGQILIMVGQQTFVAHVSARQGSDAAFGTLTAAASIGQLVGPPTVTTLSSLAIFGGQTSPNTTVGLIACVAFILLATPAYFVIRPTDRALKAARPANNESPAPVAHLLKTPGMWRSLTVSGAVLVTVDLMYAFVPVWATEQGISATVVGLLLALRAAVSVISRFGLSSPGRSLRQEDADHRLDRRSGGCAHRPAVRRRLGGHRRHDRPRTRTRHPSTPHDGLGDIADSTRIPRCDARHAADEQPPGPDHACPSPSELPPPPWGYWASSGPTPPSS